MRQAISRPHRFFKNLALVAAMALTSTLLPVSSTDAACPKIVVTTYYFDAALTQYAGTCTRTCNLVTSCFGTITSFRIIETEPCGCS